MLRTKEFFDFIRTQMDLRTTLAKSWRERWASFCTSLM